MTTSILVSEEDKIGEIFTPIKWAQWALARWKIFQRWIEGETICDPTAGTGAFIEALIAEAFRRRLEISNELLGRLFVVEIKQKHLISFQLKLKEKYDVDFHEENLFHRDIIINPLKRSFDILIGNPPWGNFTDLPQAYKEALKPYFIEYGLVANKRSALLGSSRTDIAALIIKVAIHNMLKEQGDGYFFSPLSLFTGDDAHAGFRDYTTKSDRFCIKEIIEFSTEKVFEDVRTSYCVAHFRKGEKQCFPIPYLRGGRKDFESLLALPLRFSSDPFRIVSKMPYDKKPIKVAIKPDQKPRQGVNSCGANSVFIFDSFPDFIDEQYIFPLVSKEIWNEPSHLPEKWIFVPYDRESGKPISLKKMETIKGFEYLLKFEEMLKKRKGTLIQASIRKGLWWSLLGVGSYSFAPYKVIWEAYGKHTFSPIVIGEFHNQTWQANQSLHAFIPCWSEADAKRICKGLKNPDISRLLYELNGQGKCNFAQPGKVKKILNYSERVDEQMPLLETNSASNKMHISKV